jgi:protein TonB
VVTHRFDPDYSSKARKAKVEGTVVLEKVVGTDGLARNVRIISRPLGHGLDEEAIKALNGWTFKPATIESKPVPAKVDIEMGFRNP